MLPSTLKSSAEKAGRRGRDPKWYSLFDYPPQIYQVGKMDPRLAGAQLLATLAYPELANAELRDLTALRLLARTAYNQSTVEGWFPSSAVDGVYLPVDRKVLIGGDKSFSRRIRKRIDAGYISLEPILMFGGGGTPPDRWGGRWNRSAAFRKAVSDAGINDIANFTNRYWYTSLAVIHLAAAYTILRLQERKAGLPPSPTERVISDPEYLLKWLGEAQRLESVVEASDLAIPADRLIKFRMS